MTLARDDLVEPVRNLGGGGLRKCFRNTGLRGCPRLHTVLRTKCVNCVWRSVFDAVRHFPHGHFKRFCGRTGTVAQLLNEEG